MLYYPRYHSVVFGHACRILGPMPESHETVFEDSPLGHGDPRNRMAEMRYWAAGSNIYRHPRNMEITCR